MKYAAIITPQLARQHLSIIASDEYEGRETGQPGATKAANYIANEFKSVGLEPGNKGSYFLDVAVVNSAFKMGEVTLNDTPLTSGAQYTAAAGTGTKNISAKDIVFIGYGIGAANYDDLKGQNIKGKVVMYISNGEPVKDGISKVTGTKELSEWSAGRSRRRANYVQSLKPLMILAVNMGGQGGGRGGRGGAGGGGAAGAAGAGAPPAGTPPAGTGAAAGAAGGRAHRPGGHQRGLRRDEEGRDGPVRHHVLTV